MKTNKKLEKKVERIYALRNKGLTIAKIAEKVVFSVYIAPLCKTQVVFKVSGKSV